ncbi:MAG: hypothetical protein GWP91_09045 [Rhodobacterales bacterium]|nr:hypothetical protein [Rhodobacterales bacterium]
MRPSVATALCMSVLTLVSGAARAEEIKSSWAFEARATHGEVWVMPTLVLHEDPEVNLDSFLGMGLCLQRRTIRQRRTDQAAALPGAVGLALPGAVNGELGLKWKGQFRHGRWGRAAEKLRGAVEGKRDLDETLLAIAEQNGGEATLFTWTHALGAHPLTQDSFPGELVNTSWGPVMVDHAEEPYLVSLQMGIALVAADGEVLIRYVDVYETVLSGQSGVDGAGEDLARSMAQEVVKVWAIEPELEVHGSLLAQRQ